MRIALWLLVTKPIVNHCADGRRAPKESQRPILAIAALAFPAPLAPHISFTNLRTVAVTDQELVLSALRQVGLIIAQHFELEMTDADEAITQLVAVLDTDELAEAINRLERGFGLRVVK